MKGALDGRVCVVTGATSGIGLATAEGLAREGARLVLVGRDPERGRAALARLREAGGRDDARFVRGDLSSLQEVRRVADEIAAAEPRLDVLVNNAGIVNLRRQETVDGIEEVFAVNHLAYFLLTLRLLDRLRAAPAARIVNVASDAHHWGRLDLDDLEYRRRPFKTMEVYGSSKLCNVLFTRELARRLEGSRVTANALHPGAVGTRLATNNGLLGRLGMALARPFLRSPERGAETSIFLATAPEVADRSGRYFADRREKWPSRAAQDDEAAARLWEISERRTGHAA